MGRHIDKTVSVQTIEEQEELEKSIQKFRQEVVPQIRKFPRNKVYFFEVFMKL